MEFSVGLGLTNECNLRCPHCYRPDQTIDRLTLEEVERVCDSVPVGSVNLGVGENGLHPDYLTILESLWNRGIKTSITSNGLSLARLPDATIKRFHSVELSLDFPTEPEHDALRGGGNWRMVVRELERCVGLGLPVTVTTVMMSINHDRLADLARVAATFGANLRVNVYQPSKTDRFTLSYDQFWTGFRRLLAAAALVATTEPVLAAALGLPAARFGCGRSTIRIAPDGQVLPCTYWPHTQLTVDALTTLGAGILETEAFRVSCRPPAACAGCPCRGGCAGRRALLGGFDEPDPYCPFARGDTVRIDWEPATSHDLPKIGSACTTVVSAR